MPQYHNILINPTLFSSGDEFETYHEDGQPYRYIWIPDSGWEVNIRPTVQGGLSKRDELVTLVPTCKPYDGQYTIEVNNNVFWLQLAQRKIPLRRYQKYLVKMTYISELENTPGETDPDFYKDFRFRLAVTEQNGQQHSHGWEMHPPQPGVEQHVFALFTAGEESVIDIEAEFWAVYGAANKVFKIVSIELLEVPDNYSGVILVDLSNGNAPGNGNGETPPPPTIEWDKIGIVITIAVVLIAVAISAFWFGRNQAALPAQLSNGELIPMEAVEPTTLETLLNQLFAIPALAPIIFSASIILYLTELVMRLKDRFLKGEFWKAITSEAVLVFWVLFIALAYAVAEQYQYGNVFKDVAEFITNFIEVLGPYILGALGMQVLASAGSKRVAAMGVPGFKRRFPAC